MDNDFEWDEHKNKINIEKHGIDFRNAIDVFEGPCFSMEDDRVDYGESRIITIGLLEGRMVIVVNTVRKDHIRIISMRKANEREKERFHDRLESSGSYERQ